MLVFRSIFMDLYEHSKDSVTGIWPVTALKVVYYGSWGSFSSDFAIFEILGGAGDIKNSMCMYNYCAEAYIYLGIYVTKLLSAWTEVWISTWPSRERFWLPGVVLVRFINF